MFIWYVPDLKDDQGDGRDEVVGDEAGCDERGVDGREGWVLRAKLTRTMAMGRRLGESR